MSAVEFDEWMGFTYVFGPLTVQERVDAALARSMAQRVNLATTGTRYSARDFLPQWDPKASEPSTSPEDLIAAIKSYKNQPRRSRKDRTPKEREID